VTDDSSAPPRVEWISTRQAAVILEVSEVTVWRSLDDDAKREQWWGREGVGWRLKPLMARRIYQVSRAHAQRLAGRG
jgi:uncharacterized protein YndB with AHSA1/START domain